MATLPTHRRRFLRFRLRTLLLLPLLFALGWWWVTWPEWTARAFSEAVVKRDQLAAKQHMASGHTNAHALSWLFKNTIEGPPHSGVSLVEFVGVEVEYSPRTPVDYLLARQPFKLTATWKGAVPNDPNLKTVWPSVFYWFIAARGSIFPDTSKPQPIGP
jgi:hypothetical protein